MKRVLFLSFFFLSTWCSSLLADQVVWGPMVSEELQKLDICKWERISTGFSYRVGKGFGVDARGKVTTPSPYGFIYSCPVLELGPVLNKQEVTELLSHISNDNNFIFENQPCPCCYDEPEFVFVLNPEVGDPITFLVSKHCQRVQIRKASKYVSLVPDTKALDFWAFIESFFPKIRPMHQRTRKFSPASPQESPAGWIDPKRVVGRPISDLKPGEILNIRLDIEGYIGREEYEFELERKGQSIYVCPGESMLRDFFQESEYRLSAAEVEDLQEDIYNCRWELVDQDRARHKIELTWAMESGSTQVENYNFVKTREEGFADLTVFFEIMETWKNVGEEKD